MGVQGQVYLFIVLWGQKTQFLLTRNRWRLMMYFPRKEMINIQGIRRESLIIVLISKLKKEKNCQYLIGIKL